MPVSSAANSETFTVTTTSDTDIRLTRLFDAPRALVFEAMTKPEHVPRWWGQLGDGYSVPVCEVDLRVGGKWRFVNRTRRARSRSTASTTRSRRRSVSSSPSSSSRTPMRSVVTTTLTEEGGKTRLTVTASYPSKAVRDMVLSSGMERGAAVSYDRLEDVARELQTA